VIADLEASVEGDLELSAPEDAGAFASPPVTGRRTPTPAPRALDRVAGLQKADGSWELSADLAAALGVALPVLLGRARDLGLDTPEGRRAWATLLALAWLEAHAVAERDEWALLADKARDWLRAGGGGPADASRAAEALVNLGPPA
jgi:hypothetical protein